MMKLDKSGVADFVAYCDELEGFRRVTGDEYSNWEWAFMTTQHLRKDIIGNIDDYALGWAKDTDSYEMKVKKLREMYSWIVNVYEGYLEKCVAGHYLAYDFYNLIIPMREHGWDYDAQELCEELYFSSMGFWQSMFEGYQARYEGWTKEEK